VLEAVEDWRGHPLAARTDPRARLWLTDGRLLLRRAAHRGGAARYDVIASQPSHPWVPGAGHLFTREAYALARAALADGGVFAQWLNLFEMSPDLLRSALATFRDVFPSCWLFLFQGEAVLLGFSGKPAIDTARWERLLEDDPRVRPVARAGGFDKAGDLWAHLTLDGAGIESLAPPGSTPLVRDDRPALELGLAWRVLAREPEEDLEPLLRRRFPPDVAALVPDRNVRHRWTARAIRRLLDRGRPDLALRWDDKVEYGVDREGRLVRALVARARDAYPQAEAILRGVVEELTDANRAAHGDLVAGWIDFLVVAVKHDFSMRHKLVPDAEPIAALLPDDGRVRAAHARLKEAAGDLAGARAEYHAALAAKTPPAPPGTAAELARLLLTLGPGENPEQAPLPEVVPEARVLELLRAEKDLSVLDGDTLNLRARLEMRLGDEDRAADVETELRRREVDVARDSFRSGWARLAAGDGSALEDAERAVSLDPVSARNRELQALALLQRAAHARDPLDVRALHGVAFHALGRAWALADDADVQERRARAYLRWFGVDDAPLKRLVADD
jgi:hypothetical protein